MKFSLIYFFYFKGKPKYIYEPKQVQSRGRGQSVKFSMTIISQNAKTVGEIHWYRKDGSTERPINNKDLIKEKRSDVNLSSTLTLTNLQDDDGGIYSAHGKFCQYNYNEVFNLNVYGKICQSTILTNFKLNLLD